MTEEHTDARKVARRAAERVALTYAVVAAAWILFSDQLVAGLRLPPAAATRVSESKGVAFVVVTGVILYLLVVHYLRRTLSAEERYRRLFSNATEGIVLYRVLPDDSSGEADLVVVDVNAAQLAWTGFTREEVIGRHTRTLAQSEEEMSEYLKLVRKAVLSGEPSRFEFHFEDTDIFLLTSVYALEADLWATAGTDITDLRRAQRTLKQQEDGIRRAYIDVIDAVTGGKLVLLTEQELDAALGEPLDEVHTLDSPQGLGEARRNISAAVERRFPDSTRVPELLSAVGEALNNTLKHANGGTYQTFAKDGRIQVCVGDRGPGIDFRTLPKATLVAGFSTTSTLGVGFTIMLQLADRILLATRPGLTSVVLEIEAKPARAEHKSPTASAASSTASATRSRPTS